MEAEVAAMDMGVPCTPGQNSTVTSEETGVMTQFITPEGTDSMICTEKDPITPNKEPGSKKKSGRIGSKRKLFLHANGTPSGKAKKISSGSANKPRRPLASAGTPPLTPKAADGSWVPNYPLTERQQLQYLLEVSAKEAQKDTQESESEDNQGGPPFMRLRRKEVNVKKESNAVRVSKRNERGETALHLAAIRGDVDEVASLIRSGANVNIKDYAGWSPLHEACNFGHVKIVEELIKGGASVNTPGYEDITPLHDAVINNHVQVVELLLRYGADPLRTTVQEYKAIDLARSASILELLQADSTREGAPAKPDHEEQDSTNGGGTQDESDYMGVFDEQEGTGQEAEVKQGSKSPCPPKHDIGMDADSSNEREYTSAKSPGYNSQLSAKDSSDNESPFERRTSNCSSIADTEMPDEDVDPKKLNECLDKAMIEISSYLQIDGKDASLMSAAVNSVSNSFTSMETTFKSTSSFERESHKLSTKEMSPLENNRTFSNALVDQNHNLEAFKVHERRDKSILETDCNGTLNLPSKRETRQDNLRNKENMLSTPKSGWVRRRRRSTKTLSRSESDAWREGQECIGHIRNPTWRNDVAQHRYSMRELPLNVPGYKDFLMIKKGYSIHQLPQNDDSKQDETKQDKTALGILRTTHQVEQEKLRLSLEQELVRLFGNFSRSLITRDAPYGVCTVLRSQMVTQGREVLHPTNHGPMKYPSAQGIRQDVEALLARFGRLKSNLLRRQRHELDAAVALVSLMQGGLTEDSKSLKPNIDEGGDIEDFELVPAAFREYYEDFLCMID